MIPSTDLTGVAAPLGIEPVATAPAIGDVVVVVVEAEAFSGLAAATGVVAAGLSGASGGRIIRAKVAGAATAIATELSSHGLVEGWYRVSMTYYDETDGGATYSLSIGDASLAADLPLDGAGDFLEPDLPRGGAGEPGNRREVVYEAPVFVTADSVLTLTGQADEELLRVDRFAFTRVAAPFAPVVVQAEAGAVALARTPDGRSTQVRDADNPETGGFAGLRPDFSGSGYVDFGNDAGDALSIIVTVAQAGAYDLNVRYASDTARPLTLTVNGVADPAAMAFPSTDPDGAGPGEGFDVWRFSTRTVALQAGVNTIALSIPAGATSGPNVDRLEITAAGTGPIAPEEPGVPPFSVALQLEARDGSVAILDGTPGTNGASLTRIRDPLSPEPASPELGSDGLWDGFTGAGYLDMGRNAGDAFAFEVDVPAAGVYAVTFRYANGGAADRPLALLVDGVEVARPAFAPTQAWDVWAEVTVEVALAAGPNTITVAIPADVTVFTGPNLDRVVVTEGAEPGPRETIRINFQDGATPKVEGYLVDNFQGFGDRGNGLGYGWVTEASAIDADGTTATPIEEALFPANAVNDRKGTGVLPNDGSLPAGAYGVDFGAYDPRLTGYAHFDLGSFPSRVAWEIALEDGWYEVTVSVGDTGGPNDSANRLFLEGALIADWVPTSAFKTELVTALAKVEDGFLTLSAQGGAITEMQYLEIRALPDLTPGDARAAPEDYAAFVNPVAISATAQVALGVSNGALPDGIDPTADIVLGVDVVDGRGGALLESLTDGSIRLYETLTGVEVPYNANTTGGFDSVTIAPATDLKPFTSYTLVIDGFRDRGANDDPSAPTREFEKFSTTFVTGAAPVVEAREVAFVDTVEVTSNPFAGETYTSIEMSPDKAFLYVTSITGSITRWAVNADGSLDLATKEVFTPGGDFNETAGRRGIIGIAFDPEDANTIWITDNYPIPLNGRSNAVPDFSGRISKVTLGAGGSLEDATISTYAKGLPRSNGDHVTNSLEFRANPDAGQPGEPDFLLYLTQGSNSAMGQADSAWGFRPERLLNAAILEIDHTRTPPAGGFDLATEPLPADGLNRRFADADGDLKNGGIAIRGGPFVGDFLHFTAQGVAEVRETASPTSALVKTFYDPFAADAVVRIFAEGVRNAYDLVWHSNGFLYAPTNGSAAGGNVPDDPDTTQNEAVGGVGTQSDYLFRIVEGRYYGHPNPLLDHFVLNGGNPTSGTDPNQVQDYPVGIRPDADYDLVGSYSVGNNRSPNGAIEYTSAVFGNSLQNAVIFTQYSSGDNLRAVLLNADGTVAQDFVLRDAEGQIISYVDPLDVIEGADGRLYMLTLNRSTGVSQIVRLDAAPGGETADTTADVGGDLALGVVDATDPAAVVFQVSGLDADIQTITLAVGGGQPQTVTLDGEGRFTRDLSGIAGPVAATLAVADDAANTAAASAVVTPGDPDADIAIQSLDPTFFDDRLHFSWIDNPTAVVPGAPRDVKESATVRIANDGAAPLRVLEATLTGPFELADPDVLDGLSLAAGASVEVTVLFDRSAFAARPNAVNGVFDGALTLVTNDADSPVATVDLAGFWQRRDEGGWEPNVNEVWQVFGFGNHIEGLSLNLGGGKSVLNFYDLYLPVDETEVLSPYWRIADGEGGARMTHIAAFHGPGSARIALHAPGDIDEQVLVGFHAQDGNQRLLPERSNGNFVTAAFGPNRIPDVWAGDDVFGFIAASQSSDPALNPTGPGAPTQAELHARYPGYTVVGDQVFDPDGAPVSDGYTVRMFQAVDAAGVAIPNVYLGIMDYTGINYDYNDNMFIVEGVEPVFLGAGADGFA